ncbi:MAG: hypothetical protein VKL41_10235 [Snowella sp.]|nr:hypothetical protein [Snowella sp.]
MSKFIIEPSDKPPTKSDKGMFKNVVLTISIISVISVGFILFKDTFIKKSQEFEQVEKLKQTRQCIGCNLKGADLTDLTTLKKSKEINCNDYYQRAAHAKACSYDNFTKNLLYSSVRHSAG